MIPHALPRPRRRRLVRGTLATVGVLAATGALVAFVPAQADPSSSESVVRAAPHVRDDGSFDFAAPGGRDIRVFTRLDVRLMFEDLFAKLGAAAG